MSVLRDPTNLDARDLGIALALLVSMCLHSPLFLLPDSWRFGRPSETSARPLEVRIEPRVEIVPDEASLRTTALVEDDHAARPAGVDDHSLESDEELAASVAEMMTDPALQAVLPQVSVPSDSPAQSGRVMHDADGHAIPGNMLQSVTMPAIEAIPAPDTVLATTAPSGESVLTRRLVAEAHALLERGELTSRLAIERGRQAFAVVLDRQPAADGMGLERVTAEITTEHAGQHLRTSMRFKRLAFSHFTQLVDRWDPSVLLHDDEIAGRFHSNSDIFLTYDHATAPRLFGKVTTARNIHIIDATGWQSRRKIFPGGLDTRAARIRLPQISLPGAAGDDSRDSEVHEVYEDAAIVFRRDGGYDCIALTSGTVEHRALVPDRPTYITGSEGTELYVRGEVNGRVTVYSPERIVVQGDLTYVKYVRGHEGNEDAGSYLGLVSDGTIEIDRPEVTGPGDLEIHAAVYARRRFVVRDTSARSTARLLIRGGLAAGSVSATEPRYATRIEFDPRFERVRPPGFPETDQYELEEWDGRWFVAEAGE